MQNRNLIAQSFNPNNSSTYVGVCEGELAVADVHVQYDMVHRRNKDQLFAFFLAKVHVSESESAALRVEWKVLQVQGARRVELLGDYQSYIAGEMNYRSACIV